MQDKEDLVNARKDELGDFLKKVGNEKCSPTLEVVINRMSEISVLLQEMYTDARVEKAALEAEVKKLKSAIHSLTCD